MPGLHKVIQFTDKASIKRAVVTNAPAQNTEYMLKILQLTYVFPVVIMAEDAPPGKPDPAPYQLALSRLGVNSHNAIAFEDSPSGICAAVGAGIYTVGITSSHSAEYLAAAGANMTIADFNSSQLWELLDKKMFY